MTAPQPKATPAAARKAPAKKALAEKKAPAKVTPIDTAKAAPLKKTAPAKAPEKAPVQRELSKVGPLPTPAKLEWTEKDGVHTAVSGRWRYRVKEADNGWFAEQATGSWTPLHADPQTVDQAKKIAEIVDAGAHWIGWAKYRSLSWAEIEKVAKEASE